MTAFIVTNAQHHPRPKVTCMRGSVSGVGRMPLLCRPLLDSTYPVLTDEASQFWQMTLAWRAVRRHCRRASSRSA